MKAETLYYEWGLLPTTLEGSKPEFKECMTLMNSLTRMFGLEVILFFFYYLLIVLLFCFVCLFCFVLFCFVLFCFVLFCFVLFCLILSCFVLNSSFLFSLSLGGS